MDGSQNLRKECLVAGPRRVALAGSLIGVEGENHGWFSDTVQVVHKCSFHETKCLVLDLL